MRSLKNYLPKQRSSDQVIVNARIPRSMRDTLRKLAAKNKWRASDVIRASIQKFIDDQKEK